MKKLAVYLVGIIALSLIGGCSNMSTKFQILKPVATKNLITSPSLEGAALNFPIPPFGAGSVLGWEAAGSALTLSTDHARFGTHSLMVVTAGVAMHEGTYFRMQPNTGDTKYTGSVYLRGEGRVRVRLVDMPGMIDVVSDPVQLSSDRWVRVQDLIGGVGAVSNDLRLYVETVNAQAITYYVDGILVEPGTRSTTFCDGDQDGCKWNGIYHASTSERGSQERSGGYFIDIDEPGMGVYLTLAGGVGMMPLLHNLIGRALLPGAEFQSTKILPRVITLTLWVKDPGSSGKSLRTLHERRSTLLDLVKPNLVNPTQPFVLRYLGGDFPVDIECFYEGGLEFNGDVRNPMFNSFVMRVLCTDPFWFEDNQESEEIGFVESVDDAAHIFRLYEDVWTNWGVTNTPGSIEVIAESPDGRIYIAGGFLNIDGDIRTRRIAYWDGENWYPLTDGLDSNVHTLAIDKQGRVYAGGFFTAEGGGGPALQRVGMWDPQTETWTALGAGLNAKVLDIVIANDGQVYVGGDFDDVFGGVGNSLNKIARWDPDNLTWNPMGADPGLNGIVNALAVTSDAQTVYLSGGFTQEFGGGAMLRIASYDVATDTFTQLSTGAPANVAGLALADNGILYVGGEFTTIGGVSANHIASWNGSTFSALGPGITGDIVSEITTRGNLVFCAGRFTQAGGLALFDGFAVWNGSSWIRYPFDLPDNILGYSIVDAILIRDDDIYLAGAFGDVATGITTIYAGETTVINNPGSADAKPVIDIGGPGTVVWLENRTTGDLLCLDYTLGDGEHLTIDLSNGTVISNWRGSVIGEAVIPQSNFASFRLLPGDNTLIFYIANDGPDTNAQIRFVPQHLSVDGAVR